MLKNLALSIFLIAANANAMAEWTQVSESAEVTLFVDLNSVSRTGNKVKMLTLTDLKTEERRNNGPAFFSTKKLSEFDCKNKRTHLLAMEIFSGHLATGEKIHSDNEPDIRWRPLSPDNFGNPFWKVACDQH
jgi:hypothetical protein